MALKFYNVEKAAEILGVTPAEVNHLREENRLRGFRDGATWKFKTEEVERLAAELQGTGADIAAEPAAEEDGEVLLSEVDVSGSDAGSSGTVIRDATQAEPADSDIRLSEHDAGQGSDIQLGSGSSGLELASSSGLELTGSSAGSNVGDLDLTLDEDITLEDSQVSARKAKTEAKKAAAKRTTPAGDSTLDLSDKGRLADDDDLVLGGSSGSGSDITIGGDSGISLVDPADSGLSLEEPLELGAAADESLELGEDDMLTLDEQVDTESPTELKKDDEFLLTPLEEAGEDEDSESGSQVIALDNDLVGDESATLIASGDAAAMPAMLDEDFTGAGFGGGTPPLGGAAGAAFAGGAPALADAQAMGAGAYSLPETPYSGWVVSLLIVCSLVLLLTGWMMVDLVRNMWSWQGPYNSTSAIMDKLLEIFKF